MDTNGTTVVAPIGLEHAASFHAALDEVAREKRYLAMTQAPPPEQVRAFVADNIARGLAQFVALADGEVVGWADVLPDGPQALAHRGHVGMGVRSGWRGQGIGRRLLQACIDRAWQQGLQRIELEVRTDNLPAMRLYERLGFEREGLKRRGMRVDGRFHDTVAMALLRPGDAA